MPLKQGAQQNAPVSGSVAGAVPSQPRLLAPLSPAATRPCGLFADRLSSANQTALIPGCLLPVNRKYNGIAGFNQIEHRPPPSSGGFRQEKTKLSPRRNFCTITICKCANYRSSNSIVNRSYVKEPTRERPSSDARPQKSDERRRPVYSPSQT